MKILLTFFVLLFSSSIFADCINGDCVNGYGTYTFASGNKYVGEWQDNKMHGQGTFTYADGRRDAGFYMNGEYIPDICKDMGLSINSSGYEKCINRLIEGVLN